MSQPRAPHILAACLSNLADHIKQGTISNSCAADSLKALAGEVVYLRPATGRQVAEIADTMVERFCQAQQINLKETTIQQAVDALAAFRPEDDQQTTIEEGE